MSDMSEPTFLVVTMIKGLKAVGRRRESAQTLIEFSLLLPIFLVLVMAVCDFGWALRTYLQITNAAREGARVGVVCPGGNATSAQTQMTNAAVDKSSGILASGNVTPTAPCATGQDVILSVSYDYAYITPLAGIARTLSGNNLPSTLHMSTTTKMRSE